MPLSSGRKLVACIASPHAAAAPGPTDFCKTPAPPAPVPPPIPYPNVALPTTGILGTTKTFVTGTPALTKKGKILISNGDQPGVAMGIKSSTIMGSAAMKMTSTDVKMEGGGVARSFDATSQNNDNTPGVLNGPPGDAGEMNPEDELCKAFRVAVENWCKGGGKGSFNTELFKNLNPTLASKIAREVPLVFGGAAGSAGMTCTQAVRQGIGGSAGGLAGFLRNNYIRMSKALTGGTSWLSGTNLLPNKFVPSAYALGSNQAIRKATLEGLAKRFPGAWCRFPDGLIPPSQVIEIKGPGDFDKSKGRGQTRDFRKFSKPPPIEVDCVKCNADCRNGPLEDEKDNGCGK